MILSQSVEEEKKKKKEEKQKKKKRKNKTPLGKGATNPVWGSHFGLVSSEIERKWIIFPEAEWVNPPRTKCCAHGVVLPMDHSLSQEKQLQEKGEKELHCTFNYLPEINGSKSHFITKSPLSSTSLPCISFIVQYTPTRSNFQGFTSTKSLWKYQKWHFPGQALLDSEPDP